MNSRYGIRAISESILFSAIAWLTILIGISTTGYFTRNVSLLSAGGILWGMSIYSVFLSLTGLRGWTRSVLGLLDRYLPGTFSEIDKLANEYFLLAIGVTATLVYWAASFHLTLARQPDLAARIFVWPPSWRQIVALAPLIGAAFDLRTRLRSESGRGGFAVTFLSSFNNFCCFFTLFCGLWGAEALAAIDNILSVAARQTPLEAIFGVTFNALLQKQSDAAMSLYRIQGVVVYSCTFVVVPACTFFTGLARYVRYRWARIRKSDEKKIFELMAVRRPGATLTCFWLLLLSATVFFRNGTLEPIFNRYYYESSAEPLDRALSQCLKGGTIPAVTCERQWVRGWMAEFTKVQAEAQALLPAAQRSVAQRNAVAWLQRETQDLVTDSSATESGLRIDRLHASGDRVKDQVLKLRTWVASKKPGK